ncbi:MAG: hypothetical protein ACLS7Z_03550 [Christensenellales bacterium]
MSWATRSRVPGDAKLQKGERSGFALEDRAEHVVYDDFGTARIHLSLIPTA